MAGDFNGAALRLARLFAGMSLDDVACAVQKTRQFIHKLERNQGAPTANLLMELAGTMRVEPDFFYGPRVSVLAEEHIHFRKLFTTKASIKQMAVARAELTGILVATLEKRVKLPEVRISAIEAATAEAIERAAEQCRREWEIGLGPIADVTRLAELVGAVVTSFKAISAEVDAMSFEYSRPIIVRNEAKQSAVRQRYDIAHELAHAVLHEGRVTGDHATEGEAHRFAGALLVPRAMMVKLFPRSRGQRLDWIGLAEFKRTWGISKAALLYRARLLDLLTDQQYRSGVINLKRTGQAYGEKEDETIQMEEPTLLRQAFELLAIKRAVFPDAIARSMDVSLELLQELVGFQLPAPAPTKSPLARPSLRLVA